MNAKKLIVILSGVLVLTSLFACQKTEDPDGSAGDPAGKVTASQNGEVEVGTGETGGGETGSGNENGGGDVTEDPDIVPEQTEPGESQNGTESDPAGTTESKESRNAPVKIPVGWNNSSAAATLYLHLMESDLDRTVYDDDLIRWTDHKEYYTPGDELSYCMVYDGIQMVYREMDGTGVVLLLYGDGSVEVIAQKNVVQKDKNRVERVETVMKHPAVTYPQHFSFSSVTGPWDYLISDTAFSSSLSGIRINPPEGMPYPPGYYLLDITEHFIKAHASALHKMGCSWSDLGFPKYPEVDVQDARAYYQSTTLFYDPVTGYSARSDPDRMPAEESLDHQKPESMTISGWSIRTEP